MPRRTSAGHEGQQQHERGPGRGRQRRDQQEYTRPEQVIAAASASILTPSSRSTEVRSRCVGAVPGQRRHDLGAAGAETGEGAGTASPAIQDSE